MGGESLQRRSLSTMNPARARPPLGEGPTPEGKSEVVLEQSGRAMQAARMSSDNDDGMEKKCSWL
jgi:hypothetical protein